MKLIGPNGRVQLSHQRAYSRDSLDLKPRTTGRAQTFENSPINHRSGGGIFVPPPAARVTRNPAPGFRGDVVYGPSMNIDVTTRGSVPHDMVELAEEKLSDLETVVNRPLGHVRVVLLQEENPSIALAARAEGEVSLAGKQIRGRVEAQSMGQAVNELAERLRQQLRRHIDRLTTRKRKAAEAPDGKWRNGNWIPPRPSQSLRAPGEREVIRRKVFALEPLEADEAAAVMAELDHDFYLFHDRASDLDAVVYRRDDGQLAVISSQDPDPTEAGPDGIIRERSHHPTPLALDDAVSQMDELNHRFMFFTDAEAGRGAVLYLRYDGHYGLIEPAS